jgi:hypothetical protein
LKLKKKKEKRKIRKTKQTTTTCSQRTKIYVAHHFHVLDVTIGGGPGSHKVKAPMNAVVTLVPVPFILAQVGPNLKLNIIGLQVTTMK